MDSRGKSQSSEDFARWLAKSRDAGQQTMVFAIGPPDGWSDDARRQAQTLLSLGPMTLPHELARVVLAEQLYRAFTILAGHPYHGDIDDTEKLRAAQRKEAMSWFKRPENEIEGNSEKRVRTEGLWVKCSGCGQYVFKADLEANLQVCAKCGHHLRLDARGRHRELARAGLRTGGSRA